MLESQVRRAVAAHRIALDDAALAPGDGAIGLVDVGNEFLDNNAFDRVIGLGVVVIETVDHPVGQHNDDRRQHFFADGGVEMRYESLGPGSRGSVHAVQPIENRIAPGRLVGIARRQVKAIAYVMAEDVAREGVTDRAVQLVGIGIEPLGLRLFGLRVRRGRGRFCAAGRRNRRSGNEP